MIELYFFKNYEISTIGVNYIEKEIDFLRVYCYCEGELGLEFRVFNL